MVDEIRKDKKQARERLRIFAEELRQLKGPSSPLSVPLANYFVEAIDEYLSGDARTLDQALGLTGKPGRPVTKADEHIALAARIHEARLGEISWTNMPNHLDTDTDTRELRRIYNQHEIALRTRDTAREIGEELANERKK